MGMRHVLQVLLRQKHLPDDLYASSLRRCLSLWHLVVLGVGTTIGSGLYALTGTILRYDAGPAACISYLLAGITATMSALCYSELAARVPRAGSAYTYSYVTVGELPAFIIGWDFLLEMIIGSAAASVALSSYIDQLAGHSISNFTIQTIGQYSATESSDFAEYPNLLAVSIVIVASGIVAAGARESLTISSVFVGVNAFAMMFMAVVGLWFADFDLWTPLYETGKGFMPFGVSGVLAGTASCFFAYAGFDTITTMAEETNVVLTLVIVTFVYTILSAVVSLMVSYDHVDPSSVFADAFEQVGCSWGSNVVAVGAIVSLLSAIVTALLGIPRLIYAMANDGLLFRPLGHVNSITQGTCPCSHRCDAASASMNIGPVQMPVRAVVVCSVITIAMILIFNMETLVEFLAIGTLIAYSLVAVSVTALRYRDPAGALVSPVTDVQRHNASERCKILIPSPANYGGGFERAGDGGLLGDPGRARREIEQQLV